MGGGGGGGGGMGEATTLSTFQTADFSGSGICASCHSNLTDSQGNEVSIDGHWRSTMMANSAKDPLWQAKISSEVRRNPGLQSVIEEKCSRCHMGMARYQALTDDAPVAVLGDGFLSPGHPLHEAAMDGVSCALCHQIQDADLDSPEGYTGRYRIDTSTWPPTRPAFGPYAEPVAHPMEMHSGFTPRAGEQIARSALCGTCHTLYTPTVDSQGNVVGEFPEQVTYLEWKHSALGGGVAAQKSCQDCHLPEAAGPAAISNRPWWLAARSPFGEHHLAGGNAFMLNLIKNNAAAVGASAGAAHLDATIARTRAALRAATATLSIVSASLLLDQLSVTVNLRNLAGHRLPSGIPARRMWLHFTVVDGQGRTLFESGRPQADGRIAGNDADTDAQAFEPHYDRIVSPDQVQIYEPIMLDTDGNLTHTLLRAAVYAKDNRLLPTGYDKLTAPADLAVCGEAGQDEDFIAGGDTVTYTLSLGKARRPLTVGVELLYQSVGYAFAEDLRPEGTPESTRFLEMYDRADKAAEVLASAQRQVR